MPIIERLKFRAATDAPIHPASLIKLVGSLDLSVEATPRLDNNCLAILASDVRFDDPTVLINPDVWDL
jgi:hypothetical protein